MGEFENDKNDNEIEFVAKYANEAGENLKNWSEHVKNESNKIYESLTKTEKKNQN